MTQSIYQRATVNGCSLQASCSQVTPAQHDRLFKGARKANRIKAVKIAIKAGVISESEGAKELKHSYYNPYEHWVTPTHIIYVNSCIDYFIQVH